MTSGGSQAEAGLPLTEHAVERGRSHAAVTNDPAGFDGDHPGAGISSGGRFESGPTAPDSHESGQSTASGREATPPGRDTTSAAEAALLDGAGGVDNTLMQVTVQPLAGSKVNKSPTEAQDAGSPVTTEIKPPKLKAGGNAPNRNQPGPAPTSSTWILQSQLCGGCAVKWPHEHRCHGAPCVCPDCPEAAMFTSEERKP